jgi:hypothetical protein
MKLTKAKIIALRNQPVGIIRRMRSTLAEKEYIKCEYIRLKNGVASVHGNINSAINWCGKRVAKVTDNDNCFPCVIDRQGNVYQGSWADVVEKLKTSGGA